jgi:hypothetical protein
MFMLYHSEGCNICELVLHECYINDLYTTTCSGMLGHHIPETHETKALDLLPMALKFRMSFSLVS